MSEKFIFIPAEYEPNRQNLFKVEFSNEKVNELSPCISEITRPVISQIGIVKPDPTIDTIQITFLDYVGSNLLKTLFSWFQETEKQKDSIKILSTDPVKEISGGFELSNCKVIKIDFGKNSIHSKLNQEVIVSIKAEKISIV